MDLRGYGLPIHSSYSPYPRARGTHLDHHPRDSGEDDRYSIYNLSLSDDHDHDHDPEEEEAMPAWKGSPSKKHGSRRDPGGGGGGGKNRELQTPLLATAAPRNRNPGIDTALRNLDHEVGGSLKTFQALVEYFEAQVEPLQGWAEGYTLDTVWRNMVLDKARRRGDRERFEGLAARLLGTRAAAKEAVKNAKAIKETCDDKHKYRMERQIRTAKKAVIYLDGIIDLVERAASERLACKQLVFELEEARCLLDREKHPWICKTILIGLHISLRFFVEYCTENGYADGEDMAEQQSGDPKRSKGHSKKTKGGKGQQNGAGWENAVFNQGDDGGGTEEHDGGVSFDNSLGLSQEDSGNAEWQYMVVGVGVRWRLVDDVALEMAESIPFGRVCWHCRSRIAAGGG